MEKIKSLSSYKKLADKWFSKYIRLRDSDSHGIIFCITCKKPFHYKQGDAGHFQPRQHLKTRFDPRNVNGQCKYCNNKNWNQGEQYKHGLAIDKKFGIGTAEWLTNHRRDYTKYQIYDYQEMIATYKVKVKELESKKESYET